MTGAMTVAEWYLHHCATQESALALDGLRAVG